jgi:NAD(P)-dependent dehydrogenase (short-subunit alcohol dehydrogenase family)
MQPDLGGRVAVVTGAGQGIGRAYAEALAACGAAVVVADINEAAAKEVAEAIADTGGTSHVAAVDVSERDSTQALAAGVRARFGACHIVVNNAAIYHSMRLDPQLTVDIDYWRKIFSVNLDGPLLVTQALAPMLIEAGWGRIVMQTSIAAYGSGGAYGTSKLALLSLPRARSSWHHRERHRARADPHRGDRGDRAQGADRRDDRHRRRATHGDGRRSRRHAAVPLQRQRLVGHRADSGRRRWHHRAPVTR